MLVIFPGGNSEDWLIDFCYRIWQNTGMDIISQFTLAAVDGNDLGEINEGGKLISALKALYP